MDRTHDEPGFLDRYEVWHPLTELVDREDHTDADA